MTAKAKVKNGIGFEKKLGLMSALKTGIETGIED